MNNLTEINYIPIRKDRIKNYIYNDPLKKYIYYAKLNKKEKINPTEKIKFVLKNLKEGLREMSQKKEDLKQKENGKEVRKKFNISADYSKKFNKGNKIHSFSIPKSRDIKNKSPKKKLFINTNNNYINHSVIYRLDSYRQSTFPSNNDFKRPSYKEILPSRKSNIVNGKESNYNYIRINKKSIDNNTKEKELDTINIILKKQNKELKDNIRENRFKINDLLNNIKLIRIENQNLINDKNQLLIHISNLEKELDLNKNVHINELEIKSNQITKLKEEIMRLNYILEEKENGKTILNSNHRNAISELNNRDIEKVNKIKIISLQRIINNLKNENEILKNKNKENGKTNNSIMNEDKINQLNKESQKYKTIYSNLKNLFEKKKNI